MLGVGKLRCDLARFRWVVAVFEGRRWQGAQSIPRCLLLLVGNGGVEKKKRD